MYMHRILLEEETKLTVDSERRLNPLMKEVVQKEVLKWLDAGVIYPIFDSSWVSLVLGGSQERRDHGGNK